MIAFFLAYQQARTPPGMAQHRMNAHTAALLTLLTNLSSPANFATKYRGVRPDATDEQIEETRGRELAELQAGNRPITVPEGAVFESMITGWQRTSRELLRRRLGRCSPRMIRSS